MNISKFMCYYIIILTEYFINLTLEIVINAKYKKFILNLDT